MTVNVFAQQKLMFGDKDSTQMNLDIKQLDPKATEQAAAESPSKAPPKKGRWGALRVAAK